jgi:hypothetical protein
MPRRDSRDHWDIPEIVEWREEDARFTDDRCLPLVGVFIGLAVICWPRRYCWPRSTCRPYGCSPLFLCRPGSNCFPRPCLPR